MSTIIYFVLFNQIRKEKLKWEDDLEQENKVFRQQQQAEFDLIRKEFQERKEKQKEDLEDNVSLYMYLLLFS